MRSTSPPGSTKPRPRGGSPIFFGGALLASALAGCQSPQDSPADPTDPDVTVVALTYERLPDERSWEDDVPYVMSFSLTGSAGEVVRGLAHVSGNKTEVPLTRRGIAPQEPRFEITNAGGEVVANGSFEYG